MIQEWQQNWDALLRASRPCWQILPGLAFPYHPVAAPIAYDPWVAWNHAKVDLGFMFHIKAALPGDIEALCVPRAFTADVRNRTLFHELCAPLLVDPDDSRYVVVANRWPRVPYQALLLSRSWYEQRLNSQHVVAALHWADRGAVVEFHRRAMPVNHLHFHLFLPDFVPIGRFLPMFHVDEVLDGLEIGMVPNHPLSQIVLRANRAVLIDAMGLFADTLERDAEWYYCVFLKDLLTARYVAFLTLWRKRLPRADNSTLIERARVGGVDMSLGFNAVGLFRSSKELDLSSSGIREVLEREYLVTRPDVDRLRKAFREAWRSRSGATFTSTTGPAAVRGSGLLDEPLTRVLDRLQRKSPRWYYAQLMSLSDDQLRSLFSLYTARYAGSYIPFADSPEGLVNFCRFYQHVFILPRRKDINAFFLALNRGANVILNLVSVRGPRSAGLLRCLLNTLDVESVYTFVSGRMLKRVENSWLRCDTLLTARLEGRYAFSRLPIVNPALARDLLAGHGQEAWPDADGLHCYYQPESGQKAKYGLLLGRPCCVDTPSLTRDGRLVLVEDAFLVDHRRDAERRRWMKNKARATDVLAQLSRLITNPPIWTGSPIERLIEPAQLAAYVMEPGFLNDLLNCLRLRAARVRLLATYYEIANATAGAPQPDPQIVAAALGDLERLERKLRALGDPAVLPSEQQAVLAKCAESKGLLQHHGRSVYTVTFRNTHMRVCGGVGGIVRTLWEQRKRLPGPYLVGIQGPGGVGKSTFARTIAEYWETQGKKATIIPMDGFTKREFFADIQGTADRMLTEYYRTISQRLYDGKVLEAVWDMAAFYLFLDEVAQSKRRGGSDVLVQIPCFYHRELRSYAVKTLHIDADSTIIIEGHAVINPCSNGYFQCRMWMDVDDDEILLQRMIQREPHRRDALNRRFAMLERPFALASTLAKLPSMCDLFVDNSNFACPVLFR